MTTIASPEARARAVELSKTLGRLPEFRDVSFAPESYDEATRSIEFVCSTPVQDRHGTIVKQKWRLEWFNQNPIALFAHDSRSPIGTWKLAVKGGKLRGRLYFAHGDADADKCLNLAKQGILRAVSVGFIPHSYKWEMHDDVEVLVFDDNELLEVSLVSIPANPEALARDVPLHPQEATETPAPQAATPAQKAQPAAEQREPAAASAADSAVKLAAAAEARAQAAEARAAKAEGDLVAITARAVAAEADLVEARQKLTAAETAAAAAKAAEAVEKGRADKLDAVRLARKVEDFVGVKIDPVDRAFFLAKAIKDEADFDETVKRMKPLPTEIGKQVVAAKDPSPPEGSLESDQAAARLEELARERSKSSGQEYHHAYAAVQREHPELCA